MFWDGIFYMFTLLATLAGIYLIWKILKKNSTIQKSGYLMTGGMLCGWGIFNLIEGIINHQILELHHVRDFTSHKNLWDYGFLLFGFLLLIIGALIIRKTSRKGF